MYDGVLGCRGYEMILRVQFLTCTVHSSVGNNSQKNAKNNSSFPLTHGDYLDISRSFLPSEH